MDKELHEALHRIDQSIKFFQRALEEEKVEVTPLTNHRVMFVCPNCEGAFQPDSRGLRCGNCGHLIEVKWPGGIAPTAKTLRQMYWLSRGGGDLYSEDSADSDVA